MKLSTSTRISLGFSIVTVCLLIFFSGILYHAFVQRRKYGETKFMQDHMLQQRIHDHLIGNLKRRKIASSLQDRFSQVIVLPARDQMVRDLPRTKNAVKIFRENDL